MIEFIGDSKLKIKYALERYLFQVLNIQPNNSLTLFFIVNYNLSETRNNICNKRKKEIEQCSSDSVILSPIVILTFEKIRLNFGLNRIYKRIEISSLKDLQFNQLPPLKLIVWEASEHWRELCGDYLRKIIHDLRSKSIEERERALIELNKILKEEDINKIKSELK